MTTETGLLHAIRDCHPVEFDYILFRYGNKVVRKEMNPYFLKESLQRWYVAGYCPDGVLKTFGMDRISSLRILEDCRFERRADVDIPALSCSRSLEVISPGHLRQRVHDIYSMALKRNSTAHLDI